MQRSAAWLLFGPRHTEHRSGRRGQRTLFALLLFGADPVGGVAELADLINNHRIDRRVINAYVGGALGSKGSARRETVRAHQSIGPTDGLAGELS